MTDNVVAVRGKTGEDGSSSAAWVPRADYLFWPNRLKAKHMAKSLPEYADWLDERDDLIWPKPLPAKTPKAKPYSAPLPGIRAVTWSIYGTLMRVPDGKQEFDPDPEIRLEVALEKTIHEFNMWNSMSRKPGAPSEYMMHQYRDVLKQQRIAPGIERGNFADVSLAKIWQKLIERLQQKDYEFDILQYGSLEDFSEKVAFFFHSALQGVSASENALAVMKHVAKVGRVQGLVADAQNHTLIQLLRVLGEQGKLPQIGQFLHPELLVLSCNEGVRKPSMALFDQAVSQLQRQGIGPEEVLHVGSRMTDDLAIARNVGFRTALYAGDRASLEAPKEMLIDPSTKPDRLLTNLKQIAKVLSVE